MKQATPAARNLARLLLRLEANQDQPTQGETHTVMSTVELPASFTDLLFSLYAISFLTDDIIRLRYVEIGGQLRKVVVVKMRGGNHSKDICEYEITSGGLEIGARLKDYRGLVTGVPERMKFSTGEANETLQQAKRQACP